MLPRIERGQDDRRVRGGRHAHGHGIDLGIAKQHLVVAVASIDREPPADRAEPFRIDVGDRYGPEV
ncbi:MAG TPA: hypothetical protein VFD92_25815 [Candidatus Binatia bacterium]|nr:hypothetical protein [Candidatus Binatia bacterium]